MKNLLFFASLFFAILCTGCSSDKDNSDAEDCSEVICTDEFCSIGVKIKYEDDFSMPTKQPTPNAQHLFLHEMMHVWQYQKGYAVKLRGLFSWAANYHYDLNLQSISSYSMEQQASIVADYWLLINYGLVADLANVNYVGDTTESVNTLSEKYKKVLNLFPAGVI